MNYEIEHNCTLYLGLERPNIFLPCSFNCIRNRSIAYYFQFQLTLNLPIKLIITAYTNIYLLVTHRGTLVMEMGLLHDFFGNFFHVRRKIFFLCGGEHAR